MQLFPLGIVCRLHTCLYEKFCKVAAKKLCRVSNSFRTTDDAVLHWPRSDVCRPRLPWNLNSRRLLRSRFTGGKIRRPSLLPKGIVSGSVLFSGQRGCIDQEDDVLFLPLPPFVVRSLTSIQEARGKRLQSFTGQLQRHSSRQRRQSNHSSVTENIKTTATVSYHNTGDWSTTDKINEQLSCNFKGESVCLCLRHEWLIWCSNRCRNSCDYGTSVMCEPCVVF